MFVCTLSGDASVALLGPFNFEPLSEFNRVRCKVTRSVWQQLLDTCPSHSLLPPTLGSSISNLPPLRKNTTKRKR